MLIILTYDLCIYSSGTSTAARCVTRSSSVICLARVQGTSSSNNNSYNINSNNNNNNNYNNNKNDNNNIWGDGGGSPG